MFSFPSAGIYECEVVLDFLESRFLGREQGADGSWIASALPIITGQSFESHL